jgi:X-X-X-Leu-X-X-Gly heptad repeat protein
MRKFFRLCAVILMSLFMFPANAMQGSDKLKSGLHELAGNLRTLKIKLNQLSKKLVLLRQKLDGKSMPIKPDVPISVNTGGTNPPVVESKRDSAYFIEHPEDFDPYNDSFREGAEAFKQDLR